MKTKAHTLIIYFLTCIWGLTAQSQDSAENDLNISVVVPLQIEGLSIAQLSKIESKLLRMVSNYGIAGEGYTNKFILYPKYEIYDHKVVEGLQNVHVIDAELNLIIKEVKTAKVYSVYQQEITGDGYSKKEAINQSISRIKTKGDKIQNFLSNAKTKILNYYRANCDRLYQEGSTMVRQKRYNEAIALLYPVPKEVGGDCYDKIQRKLDEAYDGYLNQTCEKNLLRAKAEISKNNNENALEILASIETESNCHSSAQELRTKIENKATANSDGGATGPLSEKGVGTNREIDNNQNPAVSAAPENTRSANASQQRIKRRSGMRAVAQAEFRRTRHQGEVDRAMSEG
ncbi:hypothetical protein [Poritiphilus flavus]|uniref:Uncharacterized protein n=1 Tax=Poritiphilus flavus TaxID=2697053 RepID=A0A6L9EHW6_9FLAO|nr:hypothetical protein [Poritiphilus flavus]NAS14321.1 hypothetical protein [Poritiphilus flavus]